jgi:ketosteroid isomerase-like protein
MKRQGVLLSAVIIGMSLSGVLRLTAAHADDQAEIKALEQRYVTAAKAKDIKAIMACYVPDESLLVFDVVPPRQYVGAKAYQKDWEELFAAYPGPAELEMSDLSVMTEGKLGYGHNIQHSTLTDKDGKKAVFIFRVSNGYRKLNGKWLISHEHVSMPVDLATGKADLASKP